MLFETGDTLLQIVWPVSEHRTSITVRISMWTVHAKIRGTYTSSALITKYKIYIFVDMRINSIAFSQQNIHRTKRTMNETIVVHNKKEWQ